MKGLSKTYSFNILELNNFRDTTVTTIDDIEYIKNNLIKLYGVDSRHWNIKSLDNIKGIFHDNQFNGDSTINGIGFIVVDAEYIDDGIYYPFFKITIKPTDTEHGRELFNKLNKNKNCIEISPIYSKIMCKGNRTNLIYNVKALLTLEYKIIK